MSSDEHDFNNIETRTVIKFFFPAKTLGEHAPLYATVKNWVTQFKCGDFSNCVPPRPGRPKTVTTPEIID